MVALFLIQYQLILYGSFTSSMIFKLPCVLTVFDFVKNIMSIIVEYHNSVVGSALLI